MLFNALYVSIVFCAIAGWNRVLAQNNGSSIPKFASNGNNPLGLVFVYRKEWENPATKRFGASIRIGSANSTINKEWIIQFAFPDSNQIITAGNFVFNKGADGQYTVRTQTKDQGLIVGGKQVVQLVFNGTMASAKQNEAPKTILLSLFPGSIAAAQKDPAALSKVHQSKYDVYVDGAGETVPVTPSARFLSLMKDVSGPPATNAPPSSVGELSNSHLNILFYIIFPCLAGAIIMVVATALFFKCRRDKQERQARERLEKVLVG